MRKTLTRTGAIGLTLGVSMTIGVAFAAWTSSGAGTGTAKSTTSADSVIAPALSAADLYPGATKSVTVTISNPNDYPVIVTSIPGGTSNAMLGTDEASSSDDCVAGSVYSDSKSAATGLAQTSGDVSIPGKGSGTYSIVTHMVADPSDACKSKTFTLPLTGADLESKAVTAADTSS